MYSLHRLMLSCSWSVCVVVITDGGYSRDGIVAMVVLWRVKLIYRT